jgi:hypothetical protein
MQYDFRYRLASKPEPSSDGSGSMYLDMFAVSRPANTQDEFMPIGLHLSVVLLASDVKVVNDMPEGTQTQQNNKKKAFKDLIRQYLKHGSFQSLNPDWDQNALQAFMDANDSAKLEVSRIDTFVTMVLAKSYPWDMNL